MYMIYDIIIMYRSKTRTELYNLITQIAKCCNINIFLFFIYLEPLNKIYQGKQNTTENNASNNKSIR